MRKDCRMEKFEILDCTLRDGGYCNQWKFGKNNILKITEALCESKIDIIECGFLTEKEVYESEKTKYNTVEQIQQILPINREGSMFVCMINYGEYDVHKLPIYDGTSVEGIRVAFHKKDMDAAINMCSDIKKKGYKVFVQPMVSLSYTDEEFLALIQQVNLLQPYAFYIVDSFGVMKRKDLMRLFYLVEHALLQGIKIGYHSHNNMQLSYSNAQALVDIRTKRDVIIDASVYGMGRGAGNLNTELFVEYLNDNIGTEYELKPILNIIDSILNRFYQENYWGYSLPNYLSAKHNIHPNYANYLCEKNTLTVENIDEIFSLMEENKKVIFDKAYIEELYWKYMENGNVQEEHMCDLKKFLKGKEILLIAPGKSCVIEKEIITKQAQKENVVTISVNFAYEKVVPQFIFVSNLRRFRELDDGDKAKCIVTSNIPAGQIYLQTNYRELLNTEDGVRDNAGLMAVKFLMNYEVAGIWLAGFDGYSHDVEENYGDDKMALATQNARLDVMNYGITKIMQEYAKDITIRFLTAPKHIILQ